MRLDALIPFSDRALASFRKDDRPRQPFFRTRSAPRAAEPPPRAPDEPPEMRPDGYGLNIIV